MAFKQTLKKNVFEVTVMQQWIIHGGEHIMMNKSDIVTIDMKSFMDFAHDLYWKGRLDERGD